MIKRIASVFFGLLMVNTTIYSQGTEIPQGRWDKMAKADVGTGIVVTVRGGEKIQGSFKSLSDDMLTVVTLDVTERKIPKSAVELIVTSEKKSGTFTRRKPISKAASLDFCLGYP